MTSIHYVLCTKGRNGFGHDQKAKLGASGGERNAYPIDFPPNVSYIEEVARVDSGTKNKETESESISVQVRCECNNQGCATTDVVVFIQSTVPENNNISHNVRRVYPPSCSLSSISTTNQIEDTPFLLLFCWSYQGCTCCIRDQEFIVAICTRFNSSKRYLGILPLKLGKDVSLSAIT